MTQAARAHGRTERAVQLALRSGALAGQRRRGRTTSLDDMAVLAWSRASHRGRPWGPGARDAALDLLSGLGTTTMAGSSLSRFRSSLRSMSAREIAHGAGGLGVWARYRGSSVGSARPVGPSAADAESLGLVEGESWMTFLAVDDLDRFELDNDVVLDPDGNLGVVERATADERSARVLLDHYLLGDVRQSSAAAQELEHRARRA